MSRCWTTPRWLARAAKVIAALLAGPSAGWGSLHSQLKRRNLMTRTSPLYFTSPPVRGRKSTQQQWESRSSGCHGPPPCGSWSGLWYIFSIKGDKTSWILPCHSLPTARAFHLVSAQMVSQCFLRAALERKLIVLLGIITVLTHSHSSSGQGTFSAW